MLSPSQFLLALEIKPTGFFLTRRPKKGNHATSTDKDHAVIKARGIQGCTQEPQGPQGTQGTHRQPAID